MPFRRNVCQWILVLTLLLAGCGQAVQSPPTATPVPATGSAPEATAQPENTPPPTAERPLAARVNGQPVYLVDYERRVAQYEAAMVAAGEDFSTAEGQTRLLQERGRILNGMVEQVLIEQAAAGMGIMVADEQVDAELAQIIESGSEATFAAWLEQNGMTRQDAWNELRAGLIGAAATQQVIDPIPETSEQVHARHILVDTREEAERILAQLQANGDFAELARTYSQDENTRENGGDLGFFPRGVLMSPEVEDAAFGLQPGQVSGVVESAFGFHIVQVVEREPNLPLSEESLRFLRERTLNEWKEALWATATIEWFVNPVP
ncbi:MAG: peptidylprolyl isomerase [Anaerolineae bacterium]|nr:peptidylprolyl isomerase [Anaerolineae bacterium]